MPNFNKVLLMGNLTRDVELRNLPSGQAVGNFGLAVNRKWRDPNTNEMKEEVTFVDCEAWGKTAENMAKYLAKGRPVFIEGRLRLDTWQDKTDGSNRSKLKVVVDNYQFVDSKPGGGGEGGEQFGRPIVRTVGAGAGGARPAASSGAPAAPSAGAPPAYEEIQSDDIPF